MADDPDETEGRRLYRARAQRMAAASIAYWPGRVRWADAAAGEGL